MFFFFTVETFLGGAENGSWVTRDNATALKIIENHMQHEITNYTYICREEMIVSQDQIHSTIYKMLAKFEVC